jgi:hypothetical protein
MAFAQHVTACTDEHPWGDCVAITCVTDGPLTHHETGAVIHEAGATVWVSHFHASVHPEHRLNPDVPAEDHRSGTPTPITVTPWCEECLPKRPA